MRKRKFADGGDVDPLEEANKAGGEDVSVSDNPGGSSAASSDAMDTDKTAAPSQTFKQAFAAARKGGDATFMWNGKKYTTELASAKKPASASSDSLKKSAKSAQNDLEAYSSMLKSPPANTSQAALDAVKRNIDTARMTKNRDSKLAADPTKSVVRMKGGGMVRGCGIAQRGLTKARSK